MLELGITLTGLVSNWIKQKDKKVCMCISVHNLLKIQGEEGRAEGRF